MSDVTFASLGLRDELLRALDTVGYKVPTPIQAQSIPAILAGQDLMASAQTGTGKTGGFVLPILQRLMAPPAPRPNGKPGARPHPFRRPIRTLVLTPTRELAAQVEQSVHTYGKFLPLSTASVFGGVGMTPQFRTLARGVDILVATPGRLFDHIRQGTADLSHVEILVLDEADRMLDMGFLQDIRRVLDLIPENAQKLLFSATFSDEIQTLANNLLKTPRRIEIARPNEESALVTQTVYTAHVDQKRSLLVHLLKRDGMGQALVFTRTKHGADRLVKQLIVDGVSAIAIHANRSQSQRTHALAEFKAGNVRIMVATDIAARGLDIPQLPHVFNFDVPNAPEDYVHRIGRTGRAGHVGEAISLVSPDEQKRFQAIEKMLGKRVPRGEAEGYTPLTESAYPIGREERVTQEQTVFRPSRPRKPQMHVEIPSKSPRQFNAIKSKPAHKRRPSAPSYR